MVLVLSAMQIINKLKSNFLETVEGSVPNFIVEKLNSLAGRNNFAIYNPEKQCIYLTGYDRPADGVKRWSALVVILIIALEKELLQCCFSGSTCEISPFRNNTWVTVMDALEFVPDNPNEISITLGLK